MRNPFARLAKRDTARPSLRERAASLKASAARVIRRKPANAAAASASVAPTLAALVGEWTAMLDRENAGGQVGRDAEKLADQRIALHRAILAYPVTSLADFAAKAPAFRDQLEDVAPPHSHPQSIEFLSWQCVLRDLSDLAFVRSAPAVDPIFAAIDTTRDLTSARNRADLLPQPAGSIDVLPEQDEAADAFFAHVDGVLLKTVPTTAAGCTALARYAVQFREDQGFNLDEDQSNEQHVRILDLIARSPLLDGAAPAMPPAPDFSGYTVTDLYRTYNALKMATDIMGLTGWTTSPEGRGDRLLDAESDRLHHFQNYVADELARRDVTERSEATFRADVLVNRAVARGNFDDVSDYAAEADAKRA
ncbi:hypothetical protein MKK58_13780 [Methylobacterium sp. J-078]|uniref:hypothetical protein n=1 Tax=Methylobacterium sp. J-078 TaxID=2836657 RepID=UPI001FBA77EB|nr:hypothetical protein [Methylobacterium sp. J-078]MCJ2045595.1 hypothetical protein [Methylobacterium sp. J-078]